MFCCKRFNDIHITNFVVNYQELENVNILDIINIEDISENDDMARQYKIIYAHGNAIN